MCHACCRWNCHRNNGRFVSSAWLRDEDSPVVARLTKLIEAVTNLNMKTAEDLQVGGNDGRNRRLVCWND